MSRVGALPAAALIATAICAQYPARAHDVVFGPESTLLMSSFDFVTMQGFTRQRGAAIGHTQQTSATLAGAVSPFTELPLSFVLALPVIAGSGTAPAPSGLGSAAIGARYRFEIPALRGAIHSDDDYFLLMLALEPPTGNVDHPPLKGPFVTDFGVLASAEWRPFSANAFFFYRYFGADPQGNKAGNASFTGLSAAYTPIDRPGAMLGFQVSVSEEARFHDFVAGAPRPNSGGEQIMLSPMVVWSVHPRFRFFTMASVPIFQALNDPRARDAWRAGIGLSYLFGKSRASPLAEVPPIDALSP